MTYRAHSARYDTMQYRFTGRSGLKLPVISLGLWQNFGGTRDYPSAFEILSYAFDSGITHFDLANNYGPPYGSAEELFGDVLARDFRPYRDELIVSSKAGWDMWPGPYGNLGSRKYVIASADQSLKRLGLDYFDIFYSHRFDPNTPLEETMGALAQLHRQGKALYVGISNYPEAQTREAYRILADMGVPLLIHQPSYSMLNRWIENDHTIDALGELGVGVIAFSPLAQGLLSGKYNGRADLVGTRAAENYSLSARAIEQRLLDATEKLAAIARARGQTMVQLALAWVLRRKEMTSALIGVRTLEQLKDNLGVLANLELSPEDLAAIDEATKGAQLDNYPLKR
ncbi:aldo/keto reductase [Paradevosia shaoguanensis]|uniref:Aldo/keto reductase n=1 Tax=Paradevosia shaoguanensis TaxID=1335043 RepID=A0AA41QQT6_9HYPH|nr:aldo/keto reductase [Paradevosia shaoguanensis]MCF1744159.1 aldo/keto reductase [Paradevosia shaoguanensis]MCI0128642.1 aldo/keto reductase [Paradevosia shaoguanensis]